jgi:hypothetical protein
MVSHPALTGTGAWVPDPSAPVCRPRYRPAGSGSARRPIRARDPDANRLLARNWAAQGAQRARKCFSGRAAVLPSLLGNGVSAGVE